LAPTRATRAIGLRATGRVLGGRAIEETWLARSGMISAEEFAHQFGSYWERQVPLLDEFVRRVNRTYDRYMPELYGVAVPSARRALINEIGFDLFGLAVRDGGVQESRRFTRAEALESYFHVKTRLRAITDSSAMSDAVPSEGELGEARGIADRISQYFRMTRVSPLTVSPAFKGCGVISQSNGDIIGGETLYEVKSVNRTFRGSDFRQLLVYVAMNYGDDAFEIENVAILNPRRGIVFEAPLEEFANQAAGMPPVELVAQVINFVSSMEVST